MSKRSTTEEFIEKARKVHGDKYDYSKVEYINEHKKVIIVCPIHGDFLQQPNSHLSKRNCPKCANRKLTTEEFVKKAKEVHGNKYDYTCTEYINKRTKVKILCKQCNKIFEIFPFNHILNKHGCPCQRPRSKSENNIAELLNLRNIKYIRQKTFKGCKDKGQLFFDFYLSDYNLCIEYQGQQHYESVKGWGGKIGLEVRQKRDQIKREYCAKNNIALLEIKYNDNIEEKLQEYFKW